MSRKKAFTGGVAVLSAAVVSGVLLAPVAGATGSHGSGADSAFAISASGLLKIDARPSVDDSDGFAEASLAELRLPTLVDLKLLNARAGSNQARASVADLRVGLGLGKPVLTASAVETTCGPGEASSSLAAAKLGNLDLDVQAPPNTAVKVPGLVSVILNKQVRHDDGSITATALSVNVDNLQKIDLASVTCAPGNRSTTPSEPTTTPAPNGKAPAPIPVKAHLDVTG